MISLLPIAKVLRYTAAFYAVIVTVMFLLALKAGGGTRSTWANLSMAISGAAILEAALLFWFYWAWRDFWRWFPQLNHWLFPDISGVWRMEIEWTWRAKEGRVDDAQATVKQDFLRVSMEVFSTNSRSQTLMAQPKKDPESGAPLLFYVYLVHPKAIGRNPAPSYQGAAILRFADVGEDELSGNYWTSVQGHGHFRLYARTGRDSRTKVK
jgi:hypothetical protein